MLQSMNQELNTVEIEEVLIGQGPLASKGALCVATFTGTLRDGTVFDSSVKHGRPFEFVLGSKKVILGWSEACKGMQAGGKRKAVVPSQLAYGERQVGLIPPHSELFYEIEMLEVRPRE